MTTTIKHLGRTVDDMSEALDIAHKYAEHLQPKIHVLGVYLFGSHINGTSDVNSDIDIAVASDSFTGDPVDDLTTLLLLKIEVDNRIEPHPFLPADFTNTHPFAREILETATRIA